MLFGSGAATADLPVGIDMDVMDVLFGFDRLSGWLAEHGPQFVGRLFPLGAAQPFRPNDELAFRGDGDNQLGHGLLAKTGPGS